MTQTEIEQLQAKIQKLEKEIDDLKQVTIFSDIQPYIEENESKFHKVKISKVGLTYLIKLEKPGILKQLFIRVARDLHQDVEKIQLLNPINGKILDPNEDIKQFVIKNDDIIQLDFQYATSDCGHGHDHSHGSHHHDDDLDSDEDFTDDENFYNSCSCSHP